MTGKERIAEAVRAARGGDDLAFAELVRAYQDVAVAYAASILGDYHLAEDAAQEAFVEAHRELGALREAEAFAGWLRRIVFKHCDRLTRRKRAPVTGVEAAAQVAAREPSAQEMLEARDVGSAVRDAVARLPEGEREVVLLYYMGEHSHRAIGEFLGVTENAVKTRLYSARRRLRKYMREIERNLEGGRPSGDPRFARRVMTAALALQVYFIDELGNKKAAGSTVASRAADVPGSQTWLIEPRQELTPKDWDTVIGLIGEMRIPGVGSEQITDAVLERICGLEHVTYLDLHDSEVTDAGLRCLARLPGLRYLNLSCAGITDRGLEVLGELRELHTLELYHQGRVSDAGVVHLKGCERLERVNLMGTGTGDGAIAALAGKVRLGQLFAGNMMTDAGLAMLHGFPVFKKWRGGREALSLMSSGAHPNYLWVNLKSAVTDGGLEKLAGLDGLYAVNLFGGTGAGVFDASGSQVTAEGLRHLAGLPNLEWLGCCAGLSTDAAMRHIAAMPRLRFLMCQDAVAGDLGFEALGRSGSLEYIWGRRCHNLTGRGFAALAGMPELRGLAVSCRNVDDGGLSWLPRFGALKEFMPMDVPDAGFQHVGKCGGLETLHCMYCPEMTDEGTGHIAGMALKSFQNWGTRITDGSLEMLGGMRSLEHLRFYSCAGITDAGLARVADLPRLRDVDLEKLPNVTREGAGIFPGHVRVNYSALTRR